MLGCETHFAVIVLALFTRQLRRLVYHEHRRDPRQHPKQRPEPVDLTHPHIQHRTPPLLVDSQIPRPSPPLQVHLIRVV